MRFAPDHANPVADGDASAVSSAMTDLLLVAPSGRGDEAELIGFTTLLGA